MTTQHEASRTLVKSPPELWAELSDEGSLARHLEAFQEIRITRLEPETAVAWEGERASGTVRLEPSGWGTKVILSARLSSAPASGDETADGRVEEIEPDPSIPSAVPAAEPGQLSPPRSRSGLIGWLVGRLRGSRSSSVAGAARSPGVAGPPTVRPAPREPVAPRAASPVPAVDAEAILVAVLDHLGQAHHRPFSRG